MTDEHTLPPSVDEADELNLNYITDQQKKKKVLIETPYRATAERSVEVHRAYLLHALSDSFKRGEAPMATHVLAPEILDDDDPLERALGIKAGWVWAEHADYIVVYNDLGISPGMQMSINYYKDTLGKHIEYRQINAKIYMSILQT